MSMTLASDVRSAIRNVRRGGWQSATVVLIPGVALGAVTAEATSVVDTYAPWHVEGITTNGLAAAFRIEGTQGVGPPDPRQ